jgi:hypothetical protein
MDVRVNQTWNKRSTAKIDFPAACAGASTHVGGAANRYDAPTPERDCVGKGPLWILREHSAANKDDCVRLRRRPGHARQDVQQQDATCAAQRSQHGGHSSTSRS